MRWKPGAQVVRGARGGEWALGAQVVRVRARGRGVLVVRGARGMWRTSVWLEAERKRGRWASSSRLQGVALACVACVVCVACVACMACVMAGIHPAAGLLMWGLRQVGLLGQLGQEEGQPRLLMVQGWRGQPGLQWLGR